MGEKVFKSITSLTIANNTSGSIKIGTVAAEMFGKLILMLHALNLSTSSEISQSLLTKLEKKLLLQRLKVL